TWAGRALLAVLTRRLSGARRRQLSLIITPRTLLRWHAELVRRHWTYPRRPPGRPRTGPAIRRLVLEMARDNPAWVCRRICGELTGLGHKIAPSAVWEILTSAGIDPAPQRTAASWKQFLSAQAKTIAAAGLLPCRAPSFSAGFRCCSSSSITVAGSTSPASLPTLPPPGQPSRPGTRS